jgi:hypothetical protein
MYGFQAVLPSQDLFERFCDSRKLRVGAAVSCTMHKGFVMLALVAALPHVALSQRGQMRPPIPAEVLARIQNAHRIFVANAGQDRGLSVNTDYSVSAYPELYQALAVLPGVQLVDSPTEADLIFQVNTTISYDLEPGPVPGPSVAVPNVTVHLSVLYPQSSGLLWQDHVDNVVVPRGYAGAVKTMLRGMWSKSLPKPSKAAAPVPLSLRAPHKLYVAAGPPAVPDSPPDPIPPSALTTPVEQAIAQTLGSRYTMVDSASDSDLVLSLWVLMEPDKKGQYPYDSMELNLLDPKTHVLLWNITTDFTRDKLGANQIKNTMPYLVKKWDKIIGTTSAPLRKTRLIGGP